MSSADITNIGPEELRQYISSHNEKDYTLLDVRQPNEYRRGHIPGAQLKPIKELVARLFELPREQDLIFYCHSGGRSSAAAALALEESVTEKQIYNLAGGILAWNGRLLQDFPKIRIFDKSKTTSEVLLSAMDLEKGALGFYEHMTRRFQENDFAQTFTALAKAEAAHAKAIYGFWKETEQDPMPFEEVFDSLKGDIIEGGEKLADALKRVGAMEINTCLGLMELALTIEYSAFDLYRAMADRSKDPVARDAFISIAHAEKNHMKTLIEALGQCEKE